MTVHNSQLWRLRAPNRTFAAAAGTPYAAEAAAETYLAGGNAADAAIAAAAAVGVTEPLMSSIGGGGFALVRNPSGEAELIDYYDVMPGKGLPASAFGADGRQKTEATHTFGLSLSSVKRQDSPFDGQLTARTTDV